MIHWWRLIYRKLDWPFKSAASLGEWWCSLSAPRAADILSVMDLVIQCKCWRLIVCVWGVSPCRRADSHPLPVDARDVWVPFLPAPSLMAASAVINLRRGIIWRVLLTWIIKLFLFFFFSSSPEGNLFWFRLVIPHKIPLVLNERLKVTCAFIVRPSLCSWVRPFLRGGGV